MGRISHLLQDYLIRLHVYDYGHAGDNAVIADLKERLCISHAYLEFHIRFLYKDRGNDQCGCKRLNTYRKSEPLN